MTVSILRKDITAYFSIKYLSSCLCGLNMYSLREQELKIYLHLHGDFFVLLK